MTDSKENNGLKPNRTRVLIRPNEYVKDNGQIYKITQIIDFESVIGINVHSSQSKVLSIQSITAVDNEIPDNGFIHQDLEEISDANWKEIERRFKLIQPLLQGAKRKEIENYSKKVNIHYTTLYRWLRNYNATGVLTALLAKKPGCASGTIRITEAAEQIIETVIDNFYLSEQRFSPQAVIDLVNIECKNRNVQAPGKNTVRSRINKIAEKERLKRQGERSKAKTLYNPVPGTFPNADSPLAVVQIDHTPMDIILVDDEYRLPIGRPWVTVAIDVYSRMITGYYLSLDAPCITSVAMCVAHSILPKENWLLLHDVDSTWPVWGFMQMIHVDNGADFRSGTLKKACFDYRIGLEFRPIDETNYGGHIERLLGTVLKRVHSLPGTTFSNIEERGSYDSDKHACMTFSDFEKWLVLYITKFYHKKKHSMLGLSPEQKWTQGIFGDLTTEGLGYLPKPSDPETLLIDFLPLISRTVQKNGVTIDGLNYYDNVLRSWINSIDPITGKKRYFIFRRDARDISYIWFYEPELHTYYRIPLSNQAIPAMNIWEFNAAKARMKEKGVNAVSDHELITALEEMHDLAQESVKKSKKARRTLQKKKVHSKSKQVTKTHQPPEPPTENTKDSFWDDDDLTSFD